METNQAKQDLDFIQSILQRSQRRIDPHAFHFVHWGWIVLLWYPTSNWLILAGHNRAAIGLGIGSVLLGLTIGTIREARLSKNPRLAGEDTFISRQVMLITAGSIVTGIVLIALVLFFPRGIAGFLRDRWLKWLP